MSHDAALAQLGTFDGKVIVDFDETLYLRNSTEDYLDCVKPRVLCALVLRVLDFIKPWRFYGGDVCMDVWRVTVIRLLFPWCDWIWRKKAAQFATDFQNKPLLDALSAKSGNWVVASLGFKPIIEPLLAAMCSSPPALIASPWRAWSYRRKGKLAAVRAGLPSITISDSMVVTESKDDLPRLESCNSPLLVEWPNAHYKRAHSLTYFPGMYLSCIKRPGEHYIRRAILQEDFAIWVLCTFVADGLFFNRIIGLLFLLISFWTIYELGYVDNDSIGAKFELKPKLSANYATDHMNVSLVQAWVWAIGSGILGIFLLSSTLRFNMPTAFAVWMFSLVGLNLWFRQYNRVDKQTRIWMFAVLQLARSAVAALLVPVNLMGAIAIASHTISRWIPYYLYRQSEGEWNNTYGEVSTLLMFLTISFSVALVNGLGPFENYMFFVVIAWAVFRARKALLTIVRQAHRIDR